MAIQDIGVMVSGVKLVLLQQSYKFGRLKKFKISFFFFVRADLRATAIYQSFDSPKNDMISKTNHY